MRPRLTTRQRREWTEHVYSKVTHRFWKPLTLTTRHYRYQWRGKWTQDTSDTSDIHHEVIIHDTTDNRDVWMFSLIVITSDFNETLNETQPRVVPLCDTPTTTTVQDITHPVKAWGICNGEYADWDKIGSALAKREPPRSEPVNLKVAPIQTRSISWIHWNHKIDRLGKQDGVLVTSKQLYYRGSETLHSVVLTDMLLRVQ